MPREKFEPCGCVPFIMKENPVAEGADIKQYEASRIAELKAKAKALAMESVGSRRWWKPETKGESIGGTVIDIFEVNGEFGLQKAISILESDGQSWSLTINWSVKQQMEEHSVKQGDVIAIAYAGMVPTRKGEGRKFVITK